MVAFLFINFEIMFFIDEFSNDVQENGDMEDSQVRKCDVISITGKQENCEAAKQALLDLVPVTVEVCQ